MTKNRHTPNSCRVHLAAAARPRLPRCQARRPRRGSGSGDPAGRLRAAVTAPRTTAGAASSTSGTTPAWRAEWRARHDAMLLFGMAMSRARRRLFSPRPAAPPAAGRPALGLARGPLPRLIRLVLSKRGQTRHADLGIRSSTSRRAALASTRPRPLHRLLIAWFGPPTAWRRRSAGAVAALAATAVRSRLRAAALAAPQRSLADLACGTDWSRRRAARRQTAPRCS